MVGELDRPPPLVCKRGGVSDELSSPTAHEVGKRVETNKRCQNRGDECMAAATEGSGCPSSPAVVVRCAVESVRVRWQSCYAVRAGCSCGMRRSRYQPTPRTSNAAAYTTLVRASLSHTLRSVLASPRLTTLPCYLSGADSIQPPLPVRRSHIYRSPALNSTVLGSASCAMAARTAIARLTRAAHSHTSYPCSGRSTLPSGSRALPSCIPLLIVLVFTHRCSPLVSSQFLIFCPSSPSSHCLAYRWWRRVHADRPH